MAKKFTRKSKPIKKIKKEAEVASEAEPAEEAKNPQDDKSIEVSVPDVGLDDKLKIERQEPDPEVVKVPKVDENASLKIEKKEEKVESVPAISANDELKIEKETGFLKETKSEVEAAPLVEEVTSEQINKKNYKLFIFGLFLGSVITALTVGYFYVSTNKAEPSASPSPKVVSEETTKETPEAINRSEWSLEVLNGTTRAGEASKLAIQLQSLGYKIVKTGNADKSDYDKTTLFVSDEQKDDEELLLSDLKDVIGSIESGEGLKDSTASARIVVGKD